MGDFLTGDRPCSTNRQFLLRQLERLHGVIVTPQRNLEAEPPLGKRPRRHQRNHNRQDCPERSAPFIRAALRDQHVNRSERDESSHSSISYSTSDLLSPSSYNFLISSADRALFMTLNPFTCTCGFSTTSPVCKEIHSSLPKRLPSCCHV